MAFFRSLVSPRGRLWGHKDKDTSLLFSAESFEPGRGVEEDGLFAYFESWHSVLLTGSAKHQQLKGEVWSLIEETRKLWGDDLDRPKLPRTDGEYYDARPFRLMVNRVLRQWEEGKLVKLNWCGKRKSKATSSDSEDGKFVDKLNAETDVKEALTWLYLALTVPAGQQGGYPWLKASTEEYWGHKGLRAWSALRKTVEDKETPPRKCDLSNGRGWRKWDERQMELLALWFSLNTVCLAWLWTGGADRDMAQADCTEELLKIRDRIAEEVRHLVLGQGLVEAKKG